MTLLSLTVTYQLLSSFVFGSFLSNRRYSFAISSIGFSGNNNSFVVPMIGNHITFLFNSSFWLGCTLTKIAFFYLAAPPNGIIIFICTIAGKNCHFVIILGSKSYVNRNCILIAFVIINFSFVFPWMEVYLFIHQWMNVV